MSEQENPIYDAYKEQNQHRQKYILAIVCFIVGFGLGWFAGWL